MVRRGRRRGDPVRRRHQRGRRGRAARAPGGRPSRRPGASTACWRWIRCRAPRASRAAATGPRLEEQLKTHGLTLRHYPQSFEYSTLRRLDRHPRRRALRHAAHPHRRLRGVGARAHPERRVGEPAAARLGRRSEPGPDADRVRGHPRRDHRGVGARAGGARASSSRRAVLFDGFEQGAEAVRALAQSRPRIPSNCRLLDPGEAALTGAAPDGRALLVLGFEAAERSGRRLDARALELCGDHGGEPRERSGESEGAWRDAFLRAPYLRDALIAGGILAETFETRRSPGTASTRSWRRCGSAPAGARAGRTGDLPHHARLPRRRSAVLHRARAGPPRLRAASSGTRSRRPRRRRSTAAGGTITHHHAVGRDHRPWYDRQRPRPVRRGAARGQGGRSTRTACSTPASLDRTHDQRPATRELRAPTGCCPGLWRLRLPLPWPGVPHVNAFAIAAGGGVVLVDTGLHEPGALRQLERALDQAGLRLEHVRLLVCTHAHSDHYGLAAPIVERVRLRAVDAPQPRAHDQGRAQDPERAFERRYRGGAPERRAGASGLAEAKEARRGQGVGIAEVVLPDRDLLPGVEVDTDLGAWQVYETPGHAPSHVVLHQPERGAADLGRPPPRPRLPLLRLRLLARPRRRVPGEPRRRRGPRRPADPRRPRPAGARPSRAGRRPTARAVAERLDRVRAAMADGPRTPFEIVPGCSWARRCPAR